MTRIFAFTLALGLALCGAARAESKLCTGTELLELWVKGYQDYAKGNASQAYAILLPLADNGFAPAQWVVGRMLRDGTGTAKDPVAALTWLKLSSHAFMRQARVEARTLSDSLSPEQSDTAWKRVEAWRPRPALLCTGEKTFKLSLDVDDNARRPLEQSKRWWFELMHDSASRADAPLHMWSAPLILFTHQRANAQIFRSQYGPVLLVNEDLADRPRAEALDALMPALQELVNEWAMFAVAEREVQTYKGRTLKGYIATDNDAFFKLMRQSIDMSATLPPELRRKSERISEIVYWPRYVHGASATNDYGAVFVPDKHHKNGGFLLFQMPPSVASAAQSTVLMVASASLAAMSENSNHKARECQFLSDYLATAKALQLDARRQTAVAGRIRDLNCTGL